MTPAPPAPSPAVPLPQPPAGQPAPPPGLCAHEKRPGLLSCLTGRSYSLAPGGFKGACCPLVPLSFPDSVQLRVPLAFHRSLGLCSVPGPKLARPKRALIPAQDPGGPARRASRPESTSPGPAFSACQACGPACAPSEWLLCRDPFPTLMGNVGPVAPTCPRGVWLRRLHPISCPRGWEEDQRPPSADVRRRAPAHEPQVPRDPPLPLGVLVFSSPARGSCAEGRAGHALRFCHLGPGGTCCAPEKKLPNEGFALCLDYQHGPSWPTR